MRGILRFTSQGISALLLAAICLFATSIVVMRLQGVRFLTVESGSMEPVIAQNSLVIVSPVHTWPKAGQVVSYDSTVTPNEVVTHRVKVVDVTHGYVVTKGDNAPTTDNPIRQRQIIGVVRWRSLTAGRFIQGLRHPFGLICAIYVPALLMIAYELRRLVRKDREIRSYQIKSW